jgi:hypothetical protein
MVRVVAARTRRSEFDTGHDHRKNRARVEAIALFFRLIGVIRGCHPREISTSFDVTIS